MPVFTRGRSVSRQIRILLPSMSLAMNFASSVGVCVAQSPPPLSQNNTRPNERTRERNELIRFGTTRRNGCDRCNTLRVACCVLCVVCSIRTAANGGGGGRIQCGSVSQRNGWNRVSTRVACGCVETKSHAVCISTSIARMKYWNRVARGMHYGMS